MNPLPMPPTQPPAPFRIVGYVTDWETAPDRIRFDRLTHINYAFLIPNADGTFAPLGNPAKLAEVVERAHAHNVRVLISVGGWGWHEQFAALAASADTRAVFVRELTAFVDRHQLDGADIDWEYPQPGGSARSFTALMRELSEALRPKGKLLTAAVIALGLTGEGVQREVFELADFINIMAYDGDQGAGHSPYRYASDAVAYWRGRGLPAAKCVLGVPFYSRPGERAYHQLMAANRGAAPADSVDYLGQTEHYNGLDTIRQKTLLARQAGSGVMIWTVSHDTSDDISLLDAIYSAAHPRT